MIHADRNPDPGFGEARKCSVVIPVNGIQTHSLIIGSPTPIQIKKKQRKAYTDSLPLKTTNYDRKNKCRYTSRVSECL
jgi:hypothetical protein